MLTRYRPKLRSLLHRLENRVHRFSPDAIAREEVIWAYRLFLDRDPESEAVIAEKLRHRQTTYELRNDIMICPEFRHKNPDVAYPTERNVVIKEIEDGLRLFLDISDYLIAFGILRRHYECDELDFVKQAVQPGSTVLDLGANIGLYTMVMARRVGPTGRLYAFEPLARSAALLRQSIAENGFGGFVTLEEAAVSDRSGAGQMVVNNDTICDGVNWLSRDGNPIPSGFDLESCPVLRLDDYDMRRPVHFIKIDVEGSEPMALAGARCILEEDRPTIFSEVNPLLLGRVAGCLPTDYISQITALGYRCLRLGADSKTEPIDSYPGDDVINVVFVPA